MQNLKNPETFRPSFIETGEMVETSKESAQYGYVTRAQYNELLRKYENRGKKIAQLISKIKRLMKVINQYRSK